MKNFLIFLIIEFFGFSLVWKTTKYYHIIGKIPFIENKLGTGSTYNFIKLFGVFIMIVTLFWLTGTLGDIFDATLGRILPHPPNQ